jgi:hypothetical protein
MRLLIISIFSVFVSAITITKLYNNTGIPGATFALKCIDDANKIYRLCRIDFAPMMLLISYDIIQKQHYFTWRDESQKDLAYDIIVKKIDENNVSLILQLAEQQEKTHNKTHRYFNVDLDKIQLIASSLEEDGPVIEESPQKRNDDPLVNTPRMSRFTWIVVFFGLVTIIFAALRFYTART